MNKELGYKRLRREISLRELVELMGKASHVVNAYPPYVAFLENELLTMERNIMRKTAAKMKYHRRVK